MFINFFFNLKSKGVPVTMHEWITLHQALASNLNDCSLTKFYHIARAVLVKNELYFDKYDMAFLDTFKDVETTDEMLEKILEGLKKVKELHLTEEEKKQIQQLDLDEVLRNFEEQLRQGHYKNHVGGNKAIGTGGRSTQGAWGYNPAGIRIGQGESRHRSAVQIAEKRSFRNYSSSITLDTRQMKVALSHLRSLLPIGQGERLDVEQTIDATCKNAGEIEFVWENKEKKSSKVLLLMDVGGSMTPYSALVERLFSAASSQISKFRHFYFHNCLYQDLWTDMERNESASTLDLLKSEDPDYKVLIVGDAEMAPSELTWKNGSVDYWYYNDTPGIVWLQRLRDKFKDIIWMNPLPRRSWNYVQSIMMIHQLFPMFELTLDGLDEGVRYLMKGRKDHLNS
ncbi:MAG TPA: VWA domain-containing protein [Spirochaetota bacterium]|nr:VWA domain-containing protein [Spirochaetota bacterium]HRZ26218.1 VWA domain-containing protein [Spirochaetota bacterium]HSA14650.1 VWA domain-containing protein [Spirochaetota bacterium]